MPSKSALLAATRGGGGTRHTPVGPLSVQQEKEDIHVLQ